MLETPAADNRLNLGASRRMSEPHDSPISITLSPIQVDEVLRAASLSAAPGLAGLISGSLRRSEPAGRGEQDRRLSRSLLRGLSILTCFGSAGEERGIVELSKEVGMSASTAHRYALTLIELGLLERSPRSRRYRLPAAPAR